ncbi:MAG: hypothetical protein ABSB41_06035 [Anaerolineales bacterium]
MQLRCTYCQTMFAIGREETLAALEDMAENNLKYYDAHCPKCRRANRVERFKLEFSYPGWKADLQAMAKQAEATAPVPASPVEPSPVEVGTTLVEAPLPPSPQVKKTHVKSHTRASVKREKNTVGAVKPRESAQKAPARKGSAAPVKGKKDAGRPAPASQKRKHAARSTGSATKARKATRPASAKGNKPAGKKKK